MDSVAVQPGFGWMGTKVVPKEYITVHDLPKSPAGKTGYFLQGYVAVARSITSVAQISWKARVFGSVFAVKSRLAIDSNANSTWQYRYAVPVGLPEKTDVKITVESVSANNTPVSGGFEILLIDN